MQSSLTSDRAAFTCSQKPCVMISIIMQSTKPDPFKSHTLIHPRILNHSIPIMIIKILELEVFWIKLQGPYEIKRIFVNAYHGNE